MVVCESEVRAVTKALAQHMFGYWTQGLAILTRMTPGASWFSHEHLTFCPELVVGISHCAQNWKADKGSYQLHQILHKIDTVLNRCHPENIRDATAESRITLMTITRHTSKRKECKFH